MGGKWDIFKSRFVKDGMALVGGNAWAQGIAFAAYLVLTRLYTPEDFGLYNIFYSYIDVLIIVSTFKYEMAVVVADNDREAAAVSRLALRINTVVSLLLLTVSLVCYFLFPFSVFNYSFSLLIAPMVFFCGTSRVYTALINRFRRFRQIALSEVSGATCGVVSKVLLGLPRLATTAWHALGLSLGTVLGRAAANINLLLCRRRLALPTDTTGDERRAAGRKFRNFPLFTMPKDLINSFSYNLPFLWLALYFDKAEVGLFALALTCTFRPVNVFNSAFERLMYVRVAEKVRAHQTIRADIVRFFKYVNIVALPLFVAAFFWGDSLLGFLFGGRWADSGYYLRCLLPWVYVMLTSSSLMFMSSVFGRQRTEFGFYLVLLLLRVVAVVVGICSGNFRLAILLFSMAGMAVSAALLVWYFRLMAHYENKEV